VLALSVLAPGVLVPGIFALGGTGIKSPRQSRQSSAAARPPTASPPANCSWLGVSRGVPGRGSMRVIEDILLSKRNGRSGSRGNGRALCRKRSERE
jgi:hypothetical protein